MLRCRFRNWRLKWVKQSCGLRLRAVWQNSSYFAPPPPVDKSWLHPSLPYIAKGVQGPSPPPLIGETKQQWKGGGGSTISLFMCEKGNLDTHNFKKSPYHGGGGIPPPPPPPPHTHTHTPSSRSVALLPRFGPTLTNPGYTTDTLLAC